MHAWLPILPIVIPLLVAAVLAGGDSLLPRLATDILSTAAVLGVLALTVWLCAITADQPVVYWLGGWRPAAQSGGPLAVTLERSSESPTFKGDALDGLDCAVRIGRLRDGHVDRRLGSTATVMRSPSAE